MGLIMKIGRVAYHIQFQSNTQQIFSGQNTPATQALKIHEMWQRKYTKMRRTFTLVWSKLYKRAMVWHKEPHKVSITASCGCSATARLSCTHHRPFKCWNYKRNFTTFNPLHLPWALQLPRETFPVRSCLPLHLPHPRKLLAPKFPRRGITMLGKLTIWLFQTTVYSCLKLWTARSTIGYLSNSWACCCFRCHRWVFQNAEVKKAYLLCGRLERTDDRRSC